MSAHRRRRRTDQFRNRGGRARADGPRPRLEALEDRTLPTAGPLDPSFGAGGVVQTNLPAGSDIHLVRSVQQSVGKIVAAGTVSGLYGVDFALERFNADGSLDTSFGVGGEVRTPLFDSSNRLVGLALQSDGKILEVGSANGDFIVVRYNADGGMDASFGPGGYVLTAFTGTADAHAVAVQADGKIVVAGGVAYGAAGHSDFALARYNADGSLDVSFGQGGEVLSPYESADAATLEVAWDVALQGDGKIVAAGQVDPSGSLVAGLVRYNTDGSIDVGFGSGGRVVTTLATGTAAVSSHGVLGRPVSVALQGDGKIVAAARDSGGVARYNSDGGIDAGFGNGGVLTVTENTYNDTGAVQAVVIDGAGRVLVGGRFAGGTWFVARYTPGGAPDGTFGSGGQVTATFSQGQADAQVTDLILDPDGGVTAVGVARTFFAPYYDLQSTSAALARYDANGAPEAGFGTNGQELVNYQGPSRDYAAAVVVQPDDKVVVAIHLLTTGGGIYGENDLALVRYNADGSLDTTFGSGGAARLAIGRNGSVNAMAFEPDGKILAVVFGFLNNSSNFRLVRFNSDGSLDGSFGSNGGVALDFGGNAVTVDANGDILVAGGKFVNGTFDQPSAVARFLPSGAPDTTFGGTGEVTTAFSNASYAAYAIAVQTDGKIVVAGNVQPHTSPYIEQLIGVARYKADGSLDTSFGSGGKVTTTLGSGNGGVPFSAANAIALEPDGRIVVGGYAESGAYPGHFLLVRYNTNGSPDGTFAQGGIAFIPDFGEVKGVAVQTDGTIVAAATAGDGLAVVSYAPNGRRDVAFTELGPQATAAGVAVGPDGRVVAAGYFGSGALNTVVARYLNQPPPAPVFVVGTDGSLMGENYVSPGWAILSPAGTILSVSAVADAAGISDVFVITTSGNSLWERTALGWADLSDGAFQQISATTDAAGNAVVFGVLGPGAGNYAGSLWEHGNGGWSELAGYGLLFPPFENPPGAVRYVSAVHTAQGAVAYAIESGSNALFEYTASGGWQEVSTGSFVQVSAGLNGSGQAVVYGVVSDGSVWEQNPAFGPVGLNTGWRVLHSTDRAEPASFLSVAAGGPDEVFAIAADHTLWTFSGLGWAELSTGSFENISARRTASGADEVFGTLTDGSLWEYSAGGGAGPTWQEVLPAGVATTSAP